MNTPIITSLLDTDLYKLTMMQCVLHRSPAAEVEYRFHCRTPGVNLVPYIPEIQKEIHALCQLYFTDDELLYLLQLDYIKPDFIEFLRLFHLNAQFIQITTEDNQLHLCIRGPWLHTILFEVPVLAIINEIYFRHTVPKPDFQKGLARLKEKTQYILEAHDHTHFRFSEFGTRRRFSKDWQFKVDAHLKNTVPEQLAGTSNVANAKALRLKPIGTMAHEFLQAYQALGPRLADSQCAALESWAQEYRGRLGIALTDVINLKAFLRDFDLYYAKLFDGLRQDSGDPIAWGEDVLAHYQMLKIDPRTKTLVFSDGLTIPRAFEIFRRFHGKINTAFGIGTNLTNDLGYTPISIVIKMTRCNGQSVAKISDTPNKTLCRDPSYLSYLKRVFEVTD